MMTTRWAFYVGGTPFVLHQHGDMSGSEAFYGATDPKTYFYSTVAEAQAASSPMAMEGDLTLSLDDARHVAALRFRQHYLNLLETFFAHLFANVQAPRHPSGWLSCYREKVLSKLVERLQSDPWRSDPKTRLLARPNELVAWLFGLERVNNDRDACMAEANRVVQLVRALAKEFNDRGNRIEYNSLKHGGRARSAAWHVSVTPDAAPDSTASVRSGNGTHFGIANNISTNQLAWRTRSQGWTLDRDVRVAIVVSKLLHNLVQVRSDEHVGQSRPYFRFDKLEVAELLRGEHSINHFEMGHPDLPKKQHLTEAQARELADIEQKAFESWLFRLDRAEAADEKAAGPSGA